MEVNANGHSGNSRRNIIGPTVDLVPGTGHHDEATGPQQALFSWTEFKAKEPVKPRGLKRRPQPATLSMFDWALEMEREKEPVAAGR